MLSTSGILSSKETLQLLSNLCILDVLQFKQDTFEYSKLWPSIIGLHENSTLKEALALLQHHRLLALPIYESLENYTGIVSVYDILSFTVFQKIFNDIQYLEAFDLSEAYSRHLKMLEDEQTLSCTQLKTFIGYTAESDRSSKQQLIMSSDDHLSDLLQKFMFNHRVLVKDPKDSKKITLLTQTDFLTFLMNSEKVKGALDGILNTPSMDVAERALKIRGPSDIDSDPNQPVQVHKHVISIPHTMQALVAFQMMHRHRVSAVAILDDEKRCIGCLSGSDLRGLVLERLQDLLLPVTQFLETMRVFGQGLNKPLKKRELITVHEKSPLKEAVDKALTERIHHIWIIDDHQHPKGVVTFSDILGMMML